MKKTMLSLGVCLMLATASFAQTTKSTETAGQPSLAVDKDAPEFKFEVEEYNFGTIKQGDIVNYDFSFTNSGKKPLIITEAHGSCGCTVPQFPKDPIKKGEKGVIKVTFNSASKMGMQDKTITLTSNAQTVTKVLHIKGTVEKADEKPADTK
jgi:hypothetical protein